MIDMNMVTKLTGKSRQTIMSKLEEGTLTATKTGGKTSSYDFDRATLEAYRETLADHHRQQLAILTAPIIEGPCCDCGAYDNDLVWCEFCDAPVCVECGLLVDGKSNDRACVTCVRQVVRAHLSGGGGE